MGIFFALRGLYLFLYVADVAIVAYEYLSSNIDVFCNDRVLKNRCKTLVIVARSLL